MAKKQKECQNKTKVETCEEQVQKKKKTRNKTRGEGRWKDKRTTTVQNID